MSQYTLHKPVLFLVFNRPGVTGKVFEAIRNAQPPRLYVAADGPRDSVATDKQACEATRKLITDGIDWECDVKKLFREQNLGCRDAVSSAIDWFFEHEEDGIILEDDCLPGEDFFRFCSEMLDYYLDNEKIMHISGSNFNFGKRYGDADYYFSRYAMVWGWASWRRAWKLYDKNLDSLNDFIEQDAEKLIPDASQRKRFIEIFKKVRNHDAEFNTWDIQWFYSVMRNYGLAVQPNVNLISNIGFTADPTHKINTPEIADIHRESIPVNIKHTKKLTPCLEADNFTFKYFQKKRLSSVKDIIIKILKHFEIK